MIWQPTRQILDILSYPFLPEEKHKQKSWASGCGYLVIKIVKILFKNMAFKIYGIAEQGRAGRGELAWSIGHEMRRFATPKRATEQRDKRGIKAQKTRLSVTPEPKVTKKNSRFAKSATNTKAFMTSSSSSPSSPSPRLPQPPYQRSRTRCTASMYIISFRWTQAMPVPATRSAARYCTAASGSASPVPQTRVRSACTAH